MPAAFFKPAYGTAHAVPFFFAYQLQASPPSAGSHLRGTATPLPARDSRLHNHRRTLRPVCGNTPQSKKARGTTAPRANTADS